MSSGRTGAQDHIEQEVRAMRKHQSLNEANARGADTPVPPVSCMEIYEAINGNLSQGELRFLHRVIERKMLVSNFRLDLEDLHLKPYYRAF